MSDPPRAQDIAQDTAGWDPPEAGPSAKEDPARGSPGAALGSLGLFSPLVLLGVVPVFVLAVFAFHLSARAIDNLVHRSNDATATITAALVEREFEHWKATLTSHAGFPVLAASVAEGDAEEVRRRLEVFVTSYSRLDRAFVTDTTGLLWADYPVAPESLGRRFDDREWYRGVMEARGPYVSEVYRRNAEPPIRVVAVAIPVRSPDTGEVQGLLVAQVRLDELSALLGRVEVGEDGFVLLRDHRGAVAAHPTLDVPNQSFDGYAETLPAPREASGVPGRGEYDDPLSGERMVASSLHARVGSHRWTVTSQQPRATAFAPIRMLALQLGGAGLLMGGLMGALFWGLAHENARRRKAEEELVALNTDLERRVARRTEELRNKEDQLAQARRMESIGRLAGGVAHDFNNLLTVMLGCADLLLGRLSKDAPERAEVLEMRRSAEQAADLTRQLLAFSRKQVLHPRILDVNESVTRMRGILERVLGEHIDLVWRLEPDLHPVKFDPGQIEQVILNLVVNARDAMPKGGKLTIETENVDLDRDYVASHPDARLGPHVMLVVTDTGIGMDPETRKKIFEPFYTTKRFGHGTGLGLSTVYGIVRQGGGNIWVYSEPGRGTTFKVYFPRTTEIPGAETEDVPEIAAPQTGTILVVEDETPVRTLLVRVLRDAGYDVIAAEGAGAATSAFRDAGGGVDLLLTDVVLPDLGGPELAERLREEQEGLRILFMSGYTDDAIVHHGVLEEGTAFLDKPIRPRELLEKVREVLALAPS